MGISPSDEFEVRENFANALKDKNASDAETRYGRILSSALE